MANIRAFQACDASSILAARTKVSTRDRLGFYLWFVIRLLSFAAPVCGSTISTIK